MARNEFGCICDRCGAYTKKRSEFYRLALPTYKSEINNSIEYVDYCGECYLFL